MRIFQGDGDVDIYDILSRLGRVTTEGYSLLSRNSDMKLQALGDIETELMNLLENTLVVNKLMPLLKSYDQDVLQRVFKLSGAQLDALRNKALKLDLSDIPAPQVVEEYVEDLTENTPTELE